MHTKRPKQDSRNRRMLSMTDACEKNIGILSMTDACEKNIGILSMPAACEKNIGMHTRRLDLYKWCCLTICY
jgi:hypothetical protein